MSKRMLLFVASVAGVAGLPLAAHAQVTSATIAQCVVDLDGRHVARLLDTVPGSADEQRATHGLFESYRACLNTTPGGALGWRDRAELALAAINGDSIGAVAARAARVAPANVSAQGGDPKLLAFRVFGDCIFKADPSASAKLARADSGSAQEKAAIDQLTPSIGACLPAGQTMKITRDQLRLLVAEPVFHANAR